jgi:hypothetical protein
LVFHGRYSLNSRTIRDPAPGMLRMSSSVAVFRLTGMNTDCFNRSFRAFNHGTRQGRSGLAARATTTDDTAATAL